MTSVQGVVLVTMSFFFAEIKSSDVSGGVCGKRAIFSEPVRIVKLVVQHIVERSRRSRRVSKVHVSVLKRHAYVEGWAWSVVKR